MHLFASDAVHLLLFSCLLLLQPPIEAQSPIYISCNTSCTYTSGSYYNTNLNFILTALASNASLTGFYATTVGKQPDGVYGLLQCKGDISKKDCQTCASTSATEIGRRCHNQKEAAIGYDNCWLRYSDTHLFSMVNDVPRAVLSNVQSVSDPILFNRHLGEMMNNLSSKAASTSSRFATGSSRTMDIYGMVQCTRDLSENSCLRCLKEMICYFPKCCDGKQGGRVLSLSCNVRYEKYSFFQLSSLPPPPSVAASPLLPLLDDTFSTGRDGLPLLVSLSQANDSDANPILQTYCGDSANYTSGSPFETNLNRLLPILLDNGPRTGFYNATYGDGFDKVYGLVQCRGDISFQDCQDCLKIANAQILSRCPNRTRVVIGYEFCLIRFADQTFFSQLDLRRIKDYSSDDRVLLDPELFNQRLGTLMRNLSFTAAYDSTKFAIGVINLDFTQIYGLAQCTRDLSDNDCLRCVQALISIIRSCCDGRQGARILSPTCNLRYEIQSFIQKTPIPQVSIEASTTNNTSKGDGKTGKSSKTVRMIVIPLVIIAVVLISIFTYIFRKKAVRKAHYDRHEENRRMESFLFDLDTVIAATDNFSDDNKVGEGGFGSVYKGRLLDGKEIAVKRLSRSSNQGLRELENEVLLVANLQHRNLVRLLGCCLTEEEKLLIYEYVPNTSLDNFLFDSVRRTLLDWETRYKIIHGITRGLLYLHEDSRLNIIHRDLKVSNILLDEDMNPKISDFGMAKLFVPDETHYTTSRIAGTYGYMAPEYVTQGQFSNKSDVFSYGVLVLEIVTGQKNTDYYESASNLLSNAWEHWIGGTVLQLMDQTLGRQCPMSEV